MGGGTGAAWRDAEAGRGQAQGGWYMQGCIRGTVCWKGGSLGGVMQAICALVEGGPWLHQVGRSCHNSQTWRRGGHAWTGAVSTQPSRLSERNCTDGRMQQFDGCGGLADGVQHEHICRGMLAAVRLYLLLSAAQLWVLGSIAPTALHSCMLALVPA